MPRENQPQKRLECTPVNGKFRPSRSPLDRSIRRQNFITGELLEMNEIDNQLHLAQVDFRLVRQKQQYRAPELRMLDLLPETTFGNFTSKRFISAETPRFT